MRELLIEGCYEIFVEALSSAQKLRVLFLNGALHALGVTIPDLTTALVGEVCEPDLFRNCSVVDLLGILEEIVYKQLEILIVNYALTVLKMVEYLLEGPVVPQHPDVSLHLLVIEVGHH